jgi:hypothetical protein
MRRGVPREQAGQRRMAGAAPAIAGRIKRREVGERHAATAVVTWRGAAAAVAVRR